ncbi:PhzF family phenazine biosynthesis protein [Pseudomonas syringae pv. syringae]|uniref:PhzF family phenazine biosynthesis protein n=1 Tax=Pseudomonas TaxID=286 RepID=UPI001CE34026|nr:MULTISPECIES: PhzF family phenazine biosynthesis protein [Pseudomonas]MCA5967987.1 PhzF family phenazine biosynthesis protein [Pseudomonas sp. P129]MEE1991741.1 PhzF family phenazine biosynthesis protein [Pseudomonas syringae pv. syringae]MEE1996796.1 PhzF family phenazine biosynthesis protein [Pseudomonas syringae pv. syringae]
MPNTLNFHQIDVFASKPLEGNALAVVSDADELTTEQMAAFARWTNLSETTFLMRPTNPDADYRVRIFTPMREIPFAGHPTLGSCYVWLGENSFSQRKDVVQECAAGLVHIRCDGPRLVFAAPPLIRGGAVEDDILHCIINGLGLTPDRIIASQWADNGPGWVAVLLRSREELLAIHPDYAVLNGLNVGAVAPWIGPYAEGDIEVRAFISSRSVEDPVTGSLNASLAQWLIPAGLMPKRYTASQGTALGRRGRIAVEQVGEIIWVGGEVQKCISGRVSF